MQDFRNLRAWQENRQLTIMIYRGRLESIRRALAKFMARLRDSRKDSDPSRKFRARNNDHRRAKRDAEH